MVFKLIHLSQWKICCWFWHPVMGRDDSWKQHLCLLWTMHYGTFHLSSNVITFHFPLSILMIIWFIKNHVGTPIILISPPTECCHKNCLTPFCLFKKTTDAFYAFLLFYNVNWFYNYILFMQCKTMSSAKWYGPIRVNKKVSITRFNAVVLRISWTPKVFAEWLSTCDWVIKRPQKKTIASK